jgi:7-carboxy-7-deazaguanine synthase
MCISTGREHDTFDMRNVAELNSQDEAKFVISSRRDYEFARDFTREHHLEDRVQVVLFSSVHEDPHGKWQGLEPRTLVEWMLEDGLGARLGLQLHKMVWDPAMRGV